MDRMPVGEHSASRHRVARNVAIVALLVAALSPSAHAIEDRFTLRAGVVDTDGENTVHGRTVYQGEDYRFTETIDFGSTELSPHVDAMLRLGERHRLIATWFRYGKDRTATLDEPIAYDEITIPAGSFARLDSEFSTGNVLYDFAVVERDRLSIGAQLGAQYARFDGRFVAQAGEERFDDSVSKSAWAPVVGVRVTWVPAGRWRIDLQGQYVNADWIGGVGDYDGSFTQASAAVEYRVTRHFGIFAGYQGIRLDVIREDDRGVVGIDQRFGGPVAGLTLAF